jgi:2-methylcitrate dehydratase PrpD
MTHRTALLDWLACAIGGRSEPAARAARGAGMGQLERVAAAGAAGHALDFDDTYEPGLCHLSAAAAPAALVVAAARRSSVGPALDAFAAGFEAMAAVARASHPALYERGLHPTAVCGPVGAAVAAARVLGLPAPAERSAIALALLRGAGLQAAFGSDGKALQVGLAAAAGVATANLAGAGASVPLERAAAGFEQALGGRYAEPDGAPAVTENWIKAYPCCLQTHSAIEAAAMAPAAGQITIAVHPLSRRAAPYDVPADGLEAKFSLPYTTAFTLLHGPPGVEAFRGVDREAAQLAARIAVREDERLGQSEAVLYDGNEELARVGAAVGSPARPMSEEQLLTKVRGLAGDRLDGALDDLRRPAGNLLAAIGL